MVAVMQDSSSDHNAWMTTQQFAGLKIQEFQEIRPDMFPEANSQLEVVVPTVSDLCQSLKGFKPLKQVPPWSMPREIWLSVLYDEQAPELLFAAMMQQLLSLMGQTRKNTSHLARRIPKAHRQAQQESWMHRLQADLAHGCHRQSMVQMDVEEDPFKLLP